MLELLIGWFAKGSLRFIDLIYCLCVDAVFAFSTCISVGVPLKKVRCLCVFTILVPGSFQRKKRRTESCATHFKSHICPFFHIRNAYSSVRSAWSYLNSDYGSHTIVIDPIKIIVKFMCVYVCFNRKRITCDLYALMRVCTTIFCDSHIWTREWERSGTERNVSIDQRKVKSDRCEQQSKQPLKLNKVNMSFYGVSSVYTPYNNSMFAIKYSSFSFALVQTWSFIQILICLWLRLISFRFVVLFSF